ncbi:hypothetical protein HYW53_01055 [Candidatus Giovannonibacteria bacterium]|nr:hypothetical protein [Candidatus Giovannonibacteria bacterium]
MNKKISFLIGAAMIGSFFILPSKVRAASECTDYGFKTWGNLIYNNYFFDDYERVEYINNLLRIHLKLKTPQNDSRPWILNYSILDDNCKNFFIKNEVRWLFLDPGIEYFSIRFITPTHYEIWNDELDVRQDCVYCSGDVPVVGDYNELFFQGSTYESVSFIRTSPYRIKGDATGPPIRNFSLAKPIACPEFFSNGDFFDNYERSEYENGYLKLYFRFNSLYDDGRGWFPRLFLYDEDCVLKKTFDPPDPYSAWIKRWTRYFSVRFTSPTHYEIWNDETNQKEECSLCSQDFSNLLPDGSEASYVSFFGLTSFPNSAVVSTPQPIEKAPALVDPVIIIPGILGSTQVYSTWYMDRILHTYDNLIETLAENGYEKEKNLFTFPYDWHESNIITAEKLRQKINKVQEVCRCEKVDLVAHSMGGLVARQYVQSDEYENDVDQLIFLGTPHLGAPNDYLMWEGGETDINFRNQLLKYYLIREAEKAGYDNLYEYIHKKPILSIKELLPVYAYIRDKNSEYLNDYPYDYPRNIFLENLDNTRFKLESRVRVANFQGLKITDDTITLIRVVSSKALPKWEYGYPEGFYEKIGDRGLERGQGDGTVPNNSAGRITENLNVIISEHGELPTKAEGLVFKELTGRDAEKLFIGSDTGWRIIIFKMLSPADMLVVSPDGKKIGRNFSTNEEVN